MAKGKADQDERDLPLEQLTEEQRIEILEKSSKKRMIMIYALGIISILLLAGQMGGLILLSQRISDLESATSNLDEVERRLVAIDEVLVITNETIEQTAERMSLTDFGKAESHVQKLIDISLAQEALSRERTIKLSQAMISLSKMVRGSRSWNDDLNLFMDQMLQRSAKLEESLNDLKPGKVDTRKEVPIDAPFESDNEN